MNLYTSHLYILLLLLLFSSGCRCNKKNSSSDPDYVEKPCANLDQPVVKSFNIQVRLFDKVSGEQLSLQGKIVPDVSYVEYVFLKKNSDDVCEYEIKFNGQYEHGFSNDLVNIATITTSNTIFISNYDALTIWVGLKAPDGKMDVANRKKLRLTSESAAAQNVNLYYLSNDQL